MKRYPVVLGATAAGLAGILTFHTTNSSHALSENLAIGPKGGQSSSSAPSSSAPSSSAPSSSTPGASSPAAGATTASTATGASEQYGYGVLSVSVTVKSSRIVTVKVANLQTADSYSQVLAQDVVPMLRRQVLVAQTSRINGVSGATYTSEAYALSLQSALDKLHFK